MTDLPSSPPPPSQDPDGMDWLNQSAPLNRPLNPSGVRPTSTPPQAEEPELVMEDEIPRARRRVPMGAPDVRVPPSAEEVRRARRAQREAQKRHQKEAEPRESMGKVLWQTTRIFALTWVAALLMATIFSYWTPDDFLSPEFRDKMRVVNTTQQAGDVLPQATPLPTQQKVVHVGIIAGHSGPPQDASFVEDPGAICDDNNDGTPELRELDINTDVAKMVVSKLLAKGYDVDLLEEFDPRLHEYRADALLSIHTNDCRDYGFGATGYNAVGPESREILRGIDEAFVNCIVDEYGRVTGLPIHPGVTVDMTSYHNFREVSSDTPVAIIELGYMYADRQVVTNQRDLLAEGIFQGFMCFLEPESRLNTAAPTPAPATVIP
ncbi:MAG: N-acetylmuramoyl-L-alanine amidase [Chloroflexi bacterium]|nr:N-acetylmuramoyl-L-alanine amidase [Chloroflexota bacterium]